MYYERTIEATVRNVSEAFPGLLADRFADVPNVEECGGIAGRACVDYLKGVSPPPSPQNKIALKT